MIYQFYFFAFFSYEVDFYSFFFEFEDDYASFSSYFYY